MDQNNKELVFLKLGGSLITDKTQPMTPRLDVLERILQEIQEAKEQNPLLEIVLGHGSGSFGHSAAKKFDTRNGVNDEAGWKGFYEVYRAARELNQLVFETGQAIDLPLMPIPLCTNASVSQRKVINWNLSPLKQTLQYGFIPLVYGDVVFDTTLGGTILSTEEIFDHLLSELNPNRILLAGIEPGIWKDYPENTTIVDEIRLTTRDENKINLQSSVATDVTGGMKSKVESMLKIIQQHTSCEIQIFSGNEAGAVKKVLSGEIIGTRIRA